MKQKKREQGNIIGKVGGHIVASIILLVSFYFMYEQIEEYVSEKSEREIEQVVVYEKSARKGLFGKPTYYISVGYSPTKLYSVSTYKKTFRELDVGDVVEGYKNGDYFYSGKAAHVEALFFYFFFLFISFYPIMYFIYIGRRLKIWGRVFEALFARILLPIAVGCIAIIVLFYMIAFLTNGVQKVFPFGKVSTEAVIIASEERELMSPRYRLTGRYLTLAYSNLEGDLFYTEKEVAYDTYVTYRDALGAKIPISYRVKNEYDLFIRELTGSSLRYMIFDGRIFLWGLFFFLGYLLIYMQLRSVWKENVASWLKFFEKKKVYTIRSLFWKAGILRYTFLMIYILSCMTVMTLLFHLLTSKNISFLKIVFLLNLTPVIWLIIGVVTMFIMRIFGSGLRNDLWNYTPEKEDVVVKRVAVPWILGLLKIVSKVWLVTYIPWFVTLLFSWWSFQQSLTIMQEIVLLLAFIPMIIYLSIMYGHLNDHLKNAPILIMSKEKLRCPHASYPWPDIKGFKSLGQGRLGIFVRKGKVEKYKVSSSIVYSLNQTEIEGDVSTLYKELRAYKKNSSK